MSGALQWYVDAIDGIDTNDGLSWQYPFQTLSYGIQEVWADPGAGTKHILVAEGAYGPAGVDPGPICLKANIWIHGGFKGYSALPNASTDYDQPDGSYFRTKILGPQDNGSVIYADWQHCLETITNAVLDGFWIENGNDGHTGKGAGLYFSGSNQDLIIENCTFKNCRADELGGAIYQGGGTLEVDRCVFKKNWALYGGAIFMGTTSKAEFCNVHLSENGGTIGDPPSELNTLGGGAIYIFEETEFTGANLSVHDNIALRGGGVFIRLNTFPDASDLHIFRHATITQNSSTPGTGAGIHITQSYPYAPPYPPGHIYIDNSILWGR